MSPGHGVGIDVCAPETRVPIGTLKLSVASHAPTQNPAGWKDLWRLSPFSIVDGGVPVPGLDGVRSRTVENAWQFLKVWDLEEGWDAVTAAAAFESDCAMRFPRGKRRKAVGHYWGATDEIIDYVEARRRIYLPAYRHLLAQPDRQAQLGRLRKASEAQQIAVWDYDSYAIGDEGLATLRETMTYMSRPFAHAFIVAMTVNGGSVG